MVAIDRELPEYQRELALSTASVGSPVGILMADVTGLFLQWCLFAHLGLQLDGGGECPFPVGAPTNLTRK